MQVTEHIADFVAKTSYENLPLHVVKETETLLTCRMLICLFVSCQRLPAAQSPDD